MVFAGVGGFAIAVGVGEPGSLGHGCLANFVLAAREGVGPLEVLGPLILLVVIGSSIWVGIDASNLGMGGFGWFVGCLLLWIVVFPIYLGSRASRKRALASQQQASAYQPRPAGPPPGWYADPSGSPGRRWWDGYRWTEHTGEQ